MKSKIILLLAGCAALGLLPTAPASSHTLERNDSIGAVLHINPDDDPVAGENTSIFFDVKDQSGKFAASKCVCSFSVNENGRQIEDKQINGTTAEYSFPRRAVYIISINGQPRQTGDFQPFTLSYTVRVDKGANATTNQRPLVPTIIFAIVALATVGAVIVLALKKSQSAKKTSQTK